jgi:phosphopantetheine adenylyltransferase
MEIHDLEKRVANLEQEILELKEQLRSLPIKDWRSTVGMFANDPDFDEIVRLGKEWRDEQNREIE